MSLVLYDTENSELVKSKIGEIAGEAEMKKVKTMEPTIEEFKDVMAIVKKYICDRKLIIYGGYAMQQLAKKRDQSVSVYGEYDYFDIEFYSYEPYMDILRLTNLLHSKGYKHVQGKEAQHKDTFTIFVNFQAYCDISYVPKNVYHKLPYIEIDCNRYIHPKVILIDRLRIFNNLLTAYPFLEKTFTRNNTLLNLYPIKNYKGDLIPDQRTEDQKKLLELIRKEILPDFGSLIVTGYYAYYFYAYKATGQEVNLKIPYYDAYSTDLATDAPKILKLLQKMVKVSNLDEKKLTVDEYSPFFQYWGHSIWFLYNGKPLLKLYNNNELCIPYYFVDKKRINITTFSQTLMMLMQTEIYFLVNNRKREMSNMQYLYTNLLKHRNRYLKEEKKTVLDDSPFQEFQLACLGEAGDPRRKYFLGIIERKKQGKRYTFAYRPEDNNVKLEAAIKEGKMMFDNYSGNKIIKPRGKILKDAPTLPVVPRNRVRKTGQGQGRKKKKSKK